MINNELYHHGVKGQKWGVRRTKAQLGKSAGSTSKKKSRVLSKISSVKKPVKKKTKGETKEKAKPEEKKKVKDMSDDELSKAIKRLEMEKRYKDLSPDETSNGRKIVDRIAKNIALPVAEDLGKQLLKSYATKAVNDHLLTDAKLGDASEYKVYTNNKKK